MSSLSNSTSSSMPDDVRDMANSAHEDQHQVFLRFDDNGLPILDDASDEGGENRHGQGPYTTASRIPNGRSSGAFFSTQDGRQRLRIPRKSILAWSSGQVRSVCNHLRQKYWATMLDFEPSRNLDDIFNFYHPLDIYRCGSRNLREVQLKLEQENINLREGCRHNHNGIYLIHFMFCWMADSSNLRKMLNWKGLDESGPIVDLCTKEDRHTLGNLCQYMSAQELLEELDISLLFSRHLLQHRVFLTPGQWFRAYHKSGNGPWPGRSICQILIAIDRVDPNRLS